VGEGDDRFATSGCKSAIETKSDAAKYQSYAKPSPENEKDAHSTLF